MTKELPQSVLPINRLCSEIQLFNLCDLDNCDHKIARFCTNEELLEKFELISEDDDQILLYEEDEFEDSAESDFDVIDEDFDGEEL